LTDKGKEHPQPRYILAGRCISFWSDALDSNDSMTVSSTSHRKWVESGFIVTFKPSYDGIWSKDRQGVRMPVDGSPDSLMTHPSSKTYGHGLRFSTV
ncbi:hypothetical protein RvY_00053-1, partial [Ramazzottius varieornatus]